MRINSELLDRLKRAHRTAQSTNRALWQDLQAAQQSIAHARGQLASAQERLAEFPRGSPPAGVDPSDWRQAKAQAQQHRYDQEDALRRQLRDQPGAFQAHIAQATEPSRADFEAHVAEAQAVVGRAEREEQAIQEAQQQAGDRAGMFHATLNAAREWLLANGHGQFAEGL
jgi:hypothetical protein